MVRTSIDIADGSQPRQLRATVSGTFRKAIDEVDDRVRELSDAGVLILSPADPRIVDQFGDFVFVASDRVRHIRTVQARHLAAIAASDFVWLVAPEGYVGTSASMEIGFAASRDIPVYSACPPSDLTLRQWVTVLNVTDVIARHRGQPIEHAVDGILLDPEMTIQRTHDDLVIAQRGLLGTPTIEQTRAADVALARIRTRIYLP